jgi:hypothetical protein
VNRRLAPFEIEPVAIFSERTCNELKLTEESFHEAIVDLPVGRRISHIPVWLCAGN